MNIAIYGYGNLGRGVECAVTSDGIAITKEVPVCLKKTDCHGSCGASQ